MPPIYLYNKSGTLIALLKKLQSAGRIILFLDYDGTLVPIKKLPVLAVISPEAQKLLKILSEQKKITLIICTGRAYTDINRLLRLKNLIIVSNHGFHIKGKNKTWIHPQVDTMLPVLRKISVRLRFLEKLFTSILVEDKKYTLTVHYRNVPKDQVTMIKNTVGAIVQQYSSFVKMTHGKKVLEIRPNILWNKGFAVKQALQMIRPAENKYASIYIGDDTTDEDAFKVLRGNAFTIKVGSNKKTSAKYFVRNPNEVLQFLKMFLDRNHRGTFDG